MAENQAIRFVDQFNKVNSSEVYTKAKEIHKSIKIIKQLPTTLKNREDINKLYFVQYF